MKDLSLVTHLVNMMINNNWSPKRVLGCIAFITGSKEDKDNVLRLLREELGNSKSSEIRELARDLPEFI